MASIHQLTPSDLIGFVARDVIASANKFRLYSEVIFSAQGEEEVVSSTRFVVMEGKEERYASADIEQTRKFYNNLVE